MPPVPCATCKLKMSSEAAVCPHCGARAADAPEGLSDVKLSPEELRAMIALDPSSRTDDAPRGLVATTLLPHPRTHGSSRLAELALTLAALPIIISGLLPLVLVRRATRGRATDVGGEASAVMTIGVSGGVGLIGTLWGSMSGGAIAAVVGAELVLLVVRGVLRANASSSRELMRLAKGD